MRSWSLWGACLAMAALLTPAAVIADGEMDKGLPAYTADGELKPPTD